MDMGKEMQLGGVATASLNGSWVTNFSAWAQLNGTWVFVGRFPGNAEDGVVARHIFGAPIRSRRLRLDVEAFFLWPSLRAAALEWAPTTTTRPPTTTTQPPPTTPQPEHAVHCVRRVNMVANSNCSYQCRAGTSGPACVPRRHAQRMEKRVSGSFQLGSHAPAAVKVRLHRLAAYFALEGQPHPEVAVSVNGGEWAQMELSRSGGMWLLMPVHDGVASISVSLWCGTGRLTFNWNLAYMKTWQRQGEKYVHSMPNPARWSWGLQGESIGDTASICSLECLHGTPFIQNSTANLEIVGVDHLLTDLAGRRWIVAHPDRMPSGPVRVDGHCRL